MKHKWPITPLGKVLTERNEEPLPDDLESGRVRIIEKISFDTGRIQLRADGSTRTGMILVKPGDLVVSGINAAKGAIAIYDEAATEPVAATIHYGAYIPNRERVNIRFLWWMIRSRFFQGLLLEHVPGGIKTELKAKRLLPIPVPLPPLQEQSRIVARVEELAAQIHEACTLCQQSIQETQDLPRSLTDNILQQIGHHVRLGDGLFDLIYRYPTFYNIAFIDEGVGLLKISNLTQDGWKIQFDNPRTFISWETNNRFPRTVLETGDVVMAARGATIGKTAYVTSEFAGFNINPNLLRLKPTATKLDGKYFWYFMRSNFGQVQFQELVTSTAKQTITVPKLKSILIPLPSLSEQRTIVAELDELRTETDELKCLQGETAAELDALLPATLERVFKGEL